MRTVICEEIEFELYEGETIVRCHECGELLQVEADPDAVEECAACGVGFSVGSAEVVPYTETNE